MSEMKIIIVGAGGHAAEIEDYLNYSNDNQTHIGQMYNVVGYLDDNPESYKNYPFKAPYLGSIEDHIIEKDCYYIIAIANIKFRKPVIESLESKGAEFMSFIHPTATISRSAKIGKGVVIAPNVNIGPMVQIGDFNMINSRSSIAHDTKIGNYNFITPNVCFSGFTTIGDENMFGINSATIPNIKVGNKNTIAAGMILDKSIGDDTTVFHRFKEKVIVVRNRK